MITASSCPSDQPTKNLGSLSSLNLVSSKNSLQHTNNVAQCFVSRVRFIWCYAYCSTAVQICITHHKNFSNPFSVSYCPLCNRMIKYDLSTSASCVLNQDLQSLSQRTHSLFCTSVRLTLVGIPSRPAALYNFAHAFFLITVLWNVSVTCLQHLNQFSKIFESSTNQDFDLRTFASRIMCGVSSSLMSDSFVCCHFTFHVFSLVLMLTSFEIPQFSSNALQLSLQHTVCP